MIIVDCEQGSQEWHQARSGVITASNFGVCSERLQSGKNKGDYKKAAHEYAFKIAVERISGEPLDDSQYETYAMRRGREMEEDARLEHEKKKAILVETAGIALTDDCLYGASVDGLIGKDGVSEYKCFIAPSSLMPILLNNDLSSVMPQVQGQLWVTDRKWCDFVLYCPALKPIDKDITIIKVERDDDYIESLEQDLIEFNGLVESYKETLQSGHRIEIK